MAEENKLVLESLTNQSPSKIPGLRRKSTHSEQYPRNGLQLNSTLILEQNEESQSSSSVGTKPNPTSGKNSDIGKSREVEEEDKVQNISAATPVGFKQLSNKSPKDSRRQSRSGRRKKMHTSSQHRGISVDRTDSKGNDNHSDMLQQFSSSHQSDREAAIVQLLKQQMAMIAQVQKQQQLIQEQMMEHSQILMGQSMNQSDMQEEFERGGASNTQSLLLVD